MWHIFSKAGEEILPQIRISCVSLHTCRFLIANNVSLGRQQSRRAAFQGLRAEMRKSSLAPNPTLSQKSRRSLEKRRVEKAAGTRICRLGLRRYKNTSLSSHYEGSPVYFWCLWPADAIIRWSKIFLFLFFSFSALNITPATLEIAPATPFFFPPRLLRL